MRKESRDIHLQIFKSMTLFLLQNQHGRSDIRKMYFWIFLQLWATNGAHCFRDFRIFATCRLFSNSSADDPLLLVLIKRITQQQQQTEQHQHEERKREKLEAKNSAGSRNRWSRMIWNDDARRTSDGRFILWHSSRHRSGRSVCVRVCVRCSVCCELLLLSAVCWL